MMKQKITAIFNGEAFYPIEAFNLEPNTKVTLTIETQLTDKKQLKMMQHTCHICYGKII